MSRFLEIFDVNEKPIFEGDTCILATKDKLWGGSYVGEAIEQFGIEEIKLEFLPNEPYLEKNVRLTFFKDGKPVVTQAEMNYFDYEINKREGSLKKGTSDSLTLKDFQEKEGSDAPCTSDADDMFLRYLLAKGIVSQAKHNREPVSDTNDNPIIKIGNNELPLSARIFVQFDDNFYLNPPTVSLYSNSDFYQGKYEGVIAVFTRKGFGYTTEFYLGNANGEITLFDKKFSNEDTHYENKALEDEYSEAIYNGDSQAADSATSKALELSKANEDGSLPYEFVPHKFEIDFLEEPRRKFLRSIMHTNPWKIINTAS